MDRKPQKRIVQIENVEELLSLLEKDYGQNWHEKVSFRISKADPANMEVIIEPVHESHRESILKELSNVVEIIEPALSDLSDLEEKYPDPHIQVEISEDKMIASIFIVPGLKRVLPTFDELKEALKKSGVIYGINEDALRKIIDESKVFAHIPVASGKKPIYGSDASIEFLFPESGMIFEKIGEKDSVDMAALYKIFTCHEGDVLAVKVPLRESYDGIAVTGEIIKVEKAKDLNLQNFVGENTKLSEDGTKIIATCDGQPYVQNSKVCVRNVLLIDKDLGYDTGNIDFNATVIIRGNAEGPFKIKADGDISIMGVLGEIQVTCGGSLKVQGGIFGRGKGIIKVSKDLTAKFINESQIFCEGNIFVEYYIMNSVIICRGDITVKGRGVIAGGAVKTSGNVEAAELGSESGVRTEIAAGIDYENEKEIAQLERNLLKAMRSIMLLSEIESSARAKITETKEIPKKEELMKILQKTAEKKKRIELEVRKIHETLKILKHNLQVKYSDTSRIRVRKICYPNVRIAIAGRKKLISDKIGPCDFFLNKNTGEISFL